MVTYTQYQKKHRRTKQFRTSTPHFDGCPFKYGTCVRVGIIKPKKPNSAQRKIAKVRLSNDRLLTAYIPGFGHQLQKHSEVMVRGGRVPDLPGVRYHILRGKKDLQTPEIISRVNRRSKYAVKKVTDSTKLKRRAIRKAKRRDALKIGFLIEVRVLEQRYLRVGENLDLIIKRNTYDITK
jgi:small subunit ribosomal protein S12